MPSDYARLRDDGVASLAKEADRGESTIALEFASAFLAERERLRVGDVAIEQLGPLRGEAPAHAPREVVEASVPASVEPAAAADVPEAQAADPVLDAAPSPAAPPRAPEVPSYLRAGPDGLGHGSTGAGSAVVGSSVVGSGAREAAREPAPRVEPAVAQDVDATMLPFARFEPILPFADALSGSALAATAATGAAPAGSAPAGGAGAGAAPAGAQEDPDATRMAPLLPGADETAYLGASVVAGPATPFDRDEEGALTLAAYARFLGELAVSPGDAAELRAKHGIADEAAQLALGSRFAAVFQREPKMRIRFEILVAQARTRAEGAK